MLTNFLRDLYKSRAVPKNVLESNLKNWNISRNKITKTFEFYEFHQAMTFMNLASEYVDQNQIKANMQEYFFLYFSSNVYNKVNVNIEELAISQLTDREFKAAVFMDEIGVKMDVIGDLVNTDYYSSHHALPERYSLDINNLLPTGNISSRYLIFPLDPWQDKDKFIHSDRNSQIKLL